MDFISRLDKQEVSSLECGALLQEEGLSAEDAALIIQRYYHSWRDANNKLPNPPPPPAYPRGANPHKQSNKEQKNKKEKKNRAPDHQAELIGFSQNVSTNCSHAHHQEFIYYSLRTTWTSIMTSLVRRV